MISNGDMIVRFTKMKPFQLAELRSVIQKRPKDKFSVGLSPEGRKAMAEACEETKIQQASKRGKRGSRGNVLFSNTVQVDQETYSLACEGDLYGDQHLNRNYNHGQFGDIFDGYDDSRSSSPRRYHGRRRSSVSKWLTERRGPSSHSISEVDIVHSVNMVPRDDDDYDELKSTDKVSAETM